MKKLVLFILTSLLVMGGYSQKGKINGTVSDTANHQQLHYAVVSLLKAKDSVLAGFTRTAANGTFELSNLQPDSFILVVSYPNYADYVYPLSVKAGDNKDVGKVVLTPKAKLLEEVFVKQKRAAVRLRGDTIEYTADSFKVRDGASVEEMLRKMPGLQVDKDGNVTAQGEKVEKVLVDGEEFFGDDPTVATKNLQADAIDKVQVFDKKSDQAAFTGIDDGTKTKTLNLTLKDDKKKGYFGKVQLGSDMQHLWNNSAMLNKFRAKKKISGYGIMSNTGKTGLDWNESGKYGDNNGMQYEEDGGFFFSFNNDDEFDNYGSFTGQGLPKSWSAGLQYSNKYDADKQNLNGSYRYNKLNTSGGSNTISQARVPGNIFYTNENQSFYSSKDRHSGSGTYDYQIDSATSIKIKANANTGNRNSESFYNSETSDTTGNMTVSNRLTTSVGTSGALNSNFLIRHRFKKVGRTISLSLDQQYKNSDLAGLLRSTNNFYVKGALDSTQHIDQRKLSDVTNEGYYTKIAYTEPIVKNLFLEVSYGLRVSNSESKKLTYDKGPGEKYDEFNDSLSNNYRYRVLTNSGGMSWKYNTKKITASLGGDVAFADFKQTDLLHDTSIRYNFTNLFPKAGFMYKFNPNSRINFNYNGNTRQPSIEQVQPVRDNSNPLNIAIGNPDLKQEFTHRFNFNYNSYKVLKQRGFYSYGSFSTTTNSISTKEITDTTGIRTFQYVNLNGNYNGYGGFGFHMKLTKLDVSLNFGGNINVSRQNNILGAITDKGLQTTKNTTDNNSYAVNFGLYKNKEKKFDISYNGEVRYNVSASTVNESQQTHYITQSHNLWLNINLPYKFELNSNVEASFRQKTDLFANNNVVLWNAYLGKKFLKNDKAMISFKVNDILNKNRGFDRTINSNILKETTYQTLRRYFMLEFVWNFSKNPGGDAPQP